MDIFRPSAGSTAAIRPARMEALALLGLRLLVGVFLVWGVADNLLDARRMAEFTAFLHQHGFPWPGLCARLSAWAQLLCGLAFVSGYGFRIAGLVCAFNFVVAVVMVDAKTGIRGAFPASMLVMTGLYFAARGPGRYALPRAYRIDGAR